MKCIANFFFTVESLAAFRIASSTFIAVRGLTRSRFRSGFLSARDRLMAWRDGEKSRSARASPRQQQTIPILYSVRKPAEDIAIKSLVLSQAGLSSRMKAELPRANGTLYIDIT